MSEIGQSNQRNAPWDRNPNTVNPGNGFDLTNVAPHALTSRVSYIVPSAFRTLIEVMVAQVFRITVAAPVGRSRTLVRYTANGAGAFGLLQAKIFANTVADKDTENVHPEFLMLTGDTLAILTEDLSTGGTCDYQGAYQGVEFNV